QKAIDLGRKLELIDDFYKFSVIKRRILEPYPISLRAINIIKFCLENDIRQNESLTCLYQELEYLDENYEYHLLGNHYLENAFSLISGGAFFNNYSWHNKARSIIVEELGEQVLEDGGHFELSPMYHKIMFFRLLELIDWYSNYKSVDVEFLQICREKAYSMRRWLENIIFSNGDIPLFNDSAEEIALSTDVLFKYADKLDIYSKNISLGASGYRSYIN